MLGLHVAALGVTNQETQGQPDRFGRGTVQAAQELALQGGEVGAGSQEPVLARGTRTTRIYYLLTGLALLGGCLFAYGWLTLASQAVYPVLFGLFSLFI